MYVATPQRIELVSGKARGYVTYVFYFRKIYARTLTYSILAYVNKNRIREWQCLRTNNKHWDSIRRQLRERKKLKQAPPPACYRKRNQHCCSVTCAMKNQALAGNLKLSKAAKMPKRRLTTLIRRQRLNKLNTANV